MPLTSPSEEEAVYQTDLRERARRAMDDAGELMWEVQQHTEQLQQSRLMQRALQVEALTAYEQVRARVDELIGVTVVLFAKR
jgi:hypothetical protein